MIPFTTSAMDGNGGVAVSVSIVRFPSLAVYATAIKRVIIIIIMIRVIYFVADETSYDGGQRNYYCRRKKIALPSQILPRYRVTTSVTARPRFQKPHGLVSVATANRYT